MVANDGLRSISPLGRDSMRGITPSPIIGKRPIIASTTAEDWTARGQVESVATGNALAVAVAALWCRRLDIDAPEIVLKGNPSDHARIIGKPQEPKQAPPKAKPVPAAAAPAVLAPDPGGRYVRRNGVVVDLFDSVLTCRGVSVDLVGDEMPMVAALARVMPSLLDFSHLERKAFGKITMNGPSRLRLLADQANVGLARAGLQIKTMPKMGMTLSELAGAA
jgi:hypothetical protein